MRNRIKTFLLTIFNTFLILQLAISQNVETDNVSTSLMSPNPYSAKHALIIGNYAYKNGWSCLPNVKTELRLIDSVFEVIGFKTTLVENLTHDEIVSTISEFIRKNDKDVNGLLIYYSGHGCSLKLPKNQFSGNIVPVDAPYLDQSSGYSGKLFSMLELNQMFQNTRAFHTLFIFNTYFAGSGFIESDAKNYNIKANIKKNAKQLIIAGEACDSNLANTSFASAVASGLLGKADQFNDNFLTASELAYYIGTKLSNNSVDCQPKLGAICGDSSSYGDFVLCKIRRGNEDNYEKAMDGKLQVKANFSGILALDGIIFQVVKKDSVLTIEDISVGLHHITVDGSLRWDTTVTIEAGKTAFLKATIKRKDIFEMVFVSGGGYQMGSDYQDGNESPRHKVFIDGFYIGKFEVTQKQWRDIMGNDPAGLYFRDCDSCPVENVNYHEIEKFISTLNIKTGMNYRLPTEAEWEYAAIGGVKQKSPDNYKYSGGDKLAEVGWYFNITKNGHVQPIGKKRPNTLGIYDMTGNVWEWCSDYFSTTYYATSAGRQNPKGPENKEATHVLRGGGWNSYKEIELRVTARRARKPELSANDIGFRLVRSED